MRIHPFCRLCLAALILLTIIPSAAAKPAARNIILVIGDGMGLTQISAAMLRRPALSLGRFPIVGLASTQSADSLVTDSAAAATALATGHKTHNKKIGLDHNGRPLATLIELAEQAGMLTGLVVTSRVTHATPAAFVAHVEHRRQETQIAAQLIGSGVDIIFGGGRDMFLPRAHGGQRKDGQDLLKQLALSHVLANDPAAFQRLNTVPAAALLSMKALPRASQRPVSLARMTRKALELLSAAEHDFFLLVEGSQIDWAGHENDAEWIIEETLDLDDAITEILAFAKAAPDTLVVVTADHETGGLALEGGLPFGQALNLDFTTHGHTATLVPVFAFGPGAEQFSGIYDNTAIGLRLRHLIESRRAP